jgi:hypothetical protein
LRGGRLKISGRVRKIPQSEELENEMSKFGGKQYMILNLEKRLHSILYSFCP